MHLYYTELVLICIYCTHTPVVAVLQILTWVFWPVVLFLNIISARFANNCNNIQWLQCFWIKNTISQYGKTSQKSLQSHLKFHGCADHVPQSRQCQKHPYFCLCRIDSSYETISHHYWWILGSISPTLDPKDLYMLHSNREAGKLVSPAAQNRLFLLSV